MKLGDIVRVVEAGAEEYAPALVTGVTEGLVDVVAFIRGAWREIHGINVVDADTAKDPAAGEHSIHVAVPLEGATPPADESAPVSPAAAPIEDEPPIEQARAAATPESAAPSS